MVPQQKKRRTWWMRFFLLEKKNQVWGDVVIFHSLLFGAFNASCNVSLVGTRRIEALMMC